MSGRSVSLTRPIHASLSKANAASASKWFRALAAVISEMDPIMSNAREFRSNHPEIARDLDVLRRASH